MKLRTLFMMVVMVTTTAFGAGQNDVVGLWKTEGDESKLEFFRCGEKICAKIAWLKEPNYTDSKEGTIGSPKTDCNNPDPALKNRPLTGLQIMEGFTPAGDSHWKEGTIYNPEDGKNYHGNLRLVAPDRLELRGYVGIPLFGRTHILTRWQAFTVKQDTPIPTNSSR